MDDCMAPSYRDPQTPGVDAEVTADLFAFLTTESNKEVSAIHRRPCR